MQWPTPLNRKPQFLWKSTRWKQIAPRENNILAGSHSGGQLDLNACMIYHFLYLLLCVWGCCVEHNDPWLKIELRLWDGRGAILIRCLLFRTREDRLKSMVLNSNPFPVNAFEVGNIISFAESNSLWYECFWHCFFFRLYFAWSCHPSIINIVETQAG